VNAPQIIDLAPRLADMRQVVLDGLGTSPKCLPAWLFYDAEGSRLFEQICEQPEYYPTRTELAILKQHGRDIAAALGENCRIVELGSGSERKARALLRLLRDPDGYVAIDISGEQLRQAITALMCDFPHIPMTGIVADYGEDAALPLEDSPGDGPLVGFFPGSTIGNMTPANAEAFLAAWAGRLQGGGMLVGVDLVKDEAVLNAAYNDAAGVTAAFNRNMLAHINAALGADFKPDRYHHHAFFNAMASRIEMHLVSDGPQQVRVAGSSFHFDPGESLHSESSYKYSVPGFQSLARAAGFEPERVWTDEKDWFSVHLLRA
jgi:L-histidine Nalpha-methyltransferase